MIWKTTYIKTPRQSSKKKKNEESTRNILDNMKHNNSHVMGTSEGEETEQGIEN